MDIWALVYKDNKVISFHQLDADDRVSSTAIVFIGTRVECENKMDELGLEYSEDFND